MDQQESPPPFPDDAKLVGDDRFSGFRFSLRTLFILSTVICLLLGFAVAVPAEFSFIIIGLLWFAGSGLLVTGLLFGKGDHRAFCIGAAIVASAMWTGIGGQFFQGIHAPLRLMFGNSELPRAVWAWFDFAVIFMTAVANGFLCIYAKRYFDRTNPPQV